MDTEPHNEFDNFILRVISDVIIPFADPGKTFARDLVVVGIRHQTTNFQKLNSAE